MLKPDLLRKALTDLLPEYREASADRLIMFIDKGNIATLYNPPRFSYEYRYQLRVVLLEYAQHPDVVMLAVVRWLNTYQPDLLMNHDRAKEAIGFVAEILDNGSLDLQLTLQLTESVRFVAREDGGADMIHLEEPVPNPMLGDVPDGKLLTGIWLNGEQLVPPANG